MASQQSHSVLLIGHPLQMKQCDLCCIMYVQAVSLCISLCAYTTMPCLVIHQVNIY